MRKILVLVLFAVLVLVAASPVLAEWISHASPSEVVVRDPIVVANDDSGQLVNPKEIDPDGLHARKIEVTNVSSNRAYKITPHLLIEYITTGGQGVGWDNPGPESGASKWVIVSVFDNTGDAYLKPGEAIILSPGITRTFLFSIWFTGDAWPGKYKFLPWFSRSEVPGKG